MDLRGARPHEDWDPAATPVHGRHISLTSCWTFDFTTAASTPHSPRRDVGCSGRACHLVSVHLLVLQVSGPRTQCEGTLGEPSQCVLRVSFVEESSVSWYLEVTDAGKSTFNPVALLLIPSSDLVVAWCSAHARTENSNAGVGAASLHFVHRERETKYIG